MPRIRKKTSNRQNTRDRAKIKKHVAEHKKKSAKASKKNVTWKSKKKADPGVPNSFIHKDKVLAEMAAEKRAAEEAKIARRQAQKQGAAEPEEEEDTPGIQSILDAVVSSRIKPAVAVSAEDDDEEDEEADVPDLVDTSLTTLQEVVDKADVVVEVVDARDVAGGRSKFVEDLITDAGGKVVVLVNKIDRVPRETLQSWLTAIPYPTFLFKSALPGSPALGKTELLQYLSTITPADGDLHVALMGLPNVGKTSVLNSLLPAKARQHEVAPLMALNAASKNPQPTTKMPSESRVEHEGKGIRVIDTPGWEFADDDDEEEDDEDDQDEEEEEEMSEEKMAKLDAMAERMTGDLLRRNLGRVDRVKDIVTLADYIVTRCNTQDLMLAYNVPFFPEGDTMAFLTAVARGTGRLRKGNQPDLESAARHVVRDWAQNTFPYYSTPPKTASGMDVDSASAAGVDMSAVLERCTPRKEMRKIGKGVIRFRGGEVDEREVILDDDYTAGLAPSDGEDEDDDDDDEDENEDVDEEDVEELEVDDLDSDEEVVEGADFEVPEDDEETEDDEESEREPSPPRKNKRKARDSTIPSPDAKKKARTAAASSKRVSFGGKLGATGSADGVAGAKEVKGILKRDREGNAKQAAPKKAASAPVTDGNGKAKSKKPVATGAYDFSAHFA